METRFERAGVTFEVVPHAKAVVVRLRTPTLTVEKAVDVLDFDAIAYPAMRRTLWARLTGR